ncbi:histone H1-like isoform X1 [Hemiscyllium ocellatum]|uniref:histone H1-like isoform X1 n=1 Tax=Hemiscyllium ocellatum TaxID=170820 RepID=UPI0029670668|nr:histone H1-like isoform X1 [Hemiscyllium ocellatum]
MSDSAAAETAPPASAPTKAKAPKKKAASPRKRPAGPKLGEQILRIVEQSKDRKGMSLVSIKKALEKSGVEVDKRNSQIKMCIRRALAKGSLVQVKGQGASGSFKLAQTRGKAEGAKKVRRAASGKKVVGKKTPAKKATVKKSPAKKPTAKKATAKRPGAGKAAPPKKKRVIKAAPKKKASVKKVKKAKSPKSPKPLSKSVKAKTQAKVPKKAAKK